MLDEINEIVTNGHFVKCGFILLGVVFTAILALKSAAGKWWWQHSKEPRKSDDIGDKYNKRHYRIDYED